MTNTESHDLKHIQTLMNVNTIETDRQKGIVQKANDKLHKLKTERRALAKKLENLKCKKKLIVSEHAIVRAIQRKYNFDIAEEQRQIIEIIGTTPIDGKYPIGDNLKAVVKDRVVVTIE